jgi:acetylornithine deacetylase/succinyl-diaminopimelate desuccinylase-like protein
MMIQNGITNFVQMLDNVMVGQVGTIPMSGVAIVNQLMFVFNLCIFGAASGAGIFTAQFKGREDHEGIRHTFRFKILIGLLLSALGAGGGSREAIAMLAEAVGMDYTGKNLGIACEDELSGALTCSLGILRYDGNEISALLDIRYPLCGDEALILGQAARRVGPAGMSVCCASSHTPLHVPAESRIVQGLLKVYHEVTGLDAYTVAIGGGTYSRTMPNTVAFGVCFPGDMDVCHIADEYMDLDKMMLGVKIFAHAIAELAGAQ